MSQPSLAHGLSKTDVTADWPGFTEEELKTLLNRYHPAWHVKQRLWRSPRPFSVAELVETSHGVLFIKRHHRRIRDAEGLREEHRFIRHLAEQGLPVPEIYHDRQGNSTPVTGEWTWEIHRAVLSGDRYRDVRSWEPFLSEQDAAAAGAMQARFHLAAEDYAAGGRLPQPLVANMTVLASRDPVATMHLWLVRHPDVAEWLADRNWQQVITEQLLPRQQRIQPQLSRQPPLWTHNDWHSSNLLWGAPDSPGGSCVSGIIDFGLSDLTCAIFDIATAAERNFIPWLELADGASVRADLRQLDAFLNGYHQVRPLTPADLHLLAEILPLIHWDFALSELHYFCSIVPAPQMADLCWEGYLIGHFRWFSEPQGRELLAFIHTWTPQENRPS